MDILAKAKPTKRPYVTTEEAVSSVEELFPWKVRHINALQSYGDRNFQVNFLDDKGTCCEAVLKVILAGEDPAETSEFVEAQIAFMQHLHSDGFNCSYPIKGKTGRFVHKKTYSCDSSNDQEQSRSIEKAECLVYALQYLPGPVLLDEPVGTETLQDLGQLLAHMHLSLQNFSHSLMEEMPDDNIWCTENSLQLRHYVTCIQNEEKASLVHSIINTFEDEILPVLSDLSKGVMWNDFHDENIIIIKGADQQNSEGTSIPPKESFGLIDFGDICYTSVIFDIAVAITYLMIDAKHVSYIKVPQYFLNGYYKIAGTFNHLFTSASLHTGANYEENCFISKELFNVLFVSICVRYCVSMVMGLYLARNKPDNSDYLLCTEQGWPQLYEMWNMDRQDIYKIWSTVL